MYTVWIDCYKTFGCHVSHMTFETEVEARDQIYRMANAYPRQFRTYVRIEDPQGKQIYFSDLDDVGEV